MAEKDLRLKQIEIKIQGKLNLARLDAWLNPKQGGGVWKKIFHIGHGDKEIFEWGRINP